MAGVVARVKDGWRLLPILARLAIIYFSARVLTLGVLSGAAAASGAGSRFGAAASLNDFIKGWDANWYWIVADVGYPDALPTGEDGRAQENAWAFMPLYAWIAKIVSLPLGHWAAGAALVSLFAGFGACWALYKLMRARLTETQALWAVVFFANGPVAALFHVGYAEALFMFFLLCALLALVSRRFEWLYALIPLMGFTRPGVLAFSLLLGLYGIWRWYHRKHDVLSMRTIVHIVALGMLGIIVGFSWQVIAGNAMGDSTAYLQTELSWRRNWIPDSAAHFIPFDGWIIGINLWLGQWQVPMVLGWTIFVFVLGVVIWWLARSRAVKNLGIEIRLFSASYLLYLLAVFFPQSSTLRLLLPLTPLWGAPAQIKPLWGKGLVLVGCIVYQIFWIYEMYAFGNTITRIP